MRSTVQYVEGWTVWMRWEDNTVQGGPSEMVISWRDPDRSRPVGGISSTVLRGINIRAAMKAAREDDFSELERNTWDRLGRLLASELEAGVTDHYLAVLSDLYVYLTAQGDRKPADKLSEAAGRSRAVIKNHLVQARKRGILTGNVGMVGGKLTEEGQRLLTEVRERTRNPRP